MTTKNALINAALGAAAAPAATELPALDGQEVYVKIIVGVLGAIVAPAAASLTKNLAKVAYTMLAGLMRGLARGFRRLGMHLLQYVRGTPSKVDDAPGEAGADVLSELAKSADKGADYLDAAARDKDSE